MLSPSTLHDLASGKRRGLLPSLFRVTAAALELPVAWYVRRRNRQYDSGLQEIVRVAAPVISVGNLTVGGTGKTPLVEWLAHTLQAQGQQVVLISRGYGAAVGQANDEARELAAKLPGVLHLQNADRFAAAQQAVAEHPGCVLLLDDAFQHRRLHRDLDIVLIDALAPFGYEHLIPRGLLREPVASLSRAQAVILSRANLVNDGERAVIQARVKTLAPQAAWAEAMHAPRELISAAGDAQSMEWLRGKRVAAFCGIGNPTGFRRTLELAGAEVVAWRELPDHCAYGESLLRSLDAWAAASAADAIVCTHKDLVKIARDQLGQRPLYALVVGLEFTVGEAALESLFQSAIGKLT